MNKSTYLESKISKANFADSGAMWAKMAEILESVLKWEGHTSTVAALNALTNPMPNLVFQLTSAGTLTAGTDLAVVVGETVYFDGASWQKIQIGNKKIIEVVTDNKTLTAADSGKIFLIGTDAKTITLPATVKGVEFTFINIGAAGNNIITVSPAAADGIAGTVTLDASVVVLDGTVDKDLVNTKATSKTGDTAKILGTGTTGTAAWILTDSTGIWAQGA